MKEDFNFLKCIRLKNSKILNTVDIDEFVTKILNLPGEENPILKFDSDRVGDDFGDSPISNNSSKVFVGGRRANFQTMIIHDCLEIDKHWD